MMDNVSHGDSLSARRSISHPTLRLRDVAEKLTNCAGTAWLSECSHLPKKLQPGLGRARHVGNSAAWFYIPPPGYDYKWSAD